MLFQITSPNTVSLQRGDGDEREGTGESERKTGQNDFIMTPNDDPYRIIIGMEESPGKDDLCPIRWATAARPAGSLSNSGSTSTENAII